MDARFRRALSLLDFFSGMKQGSLVKLSQMLCSMSLYTSRDTSSNILEISLSAVLPSDDDDLTASSVLFLSELEMFTCIGALRAIYFSHIRDARRYCSDLISWIAPSIICVPKAGATRFPFLNSSASSQKRTSSSKKLFFC